MKKSLLAILAFSMVALSAHAENKPTKPAPAAAQTPQDVQAVAAAVAAQLQAQIQAQVALQLTQLQQSQSSTTISGGNMFSVTGDTNPKLPVATATAPGLSASGASDTNGTCFGSTSGGVQAPGLGITVGSTWQDDGCDLRYDAIALRAAGKHDAADAVLCMKANIRKAMKIAGTPCKEEAPKQAAAQPTHADPLAAARQARYEAAQAQ